MQDRQREELLKDYFREMSTLLLDYNLRYSDPESEVRSVARVRTLATLRKLDGTRKGFIILFLSETKLIKRDDAVVSLSGSNLRDAELISVDLSNTNLRNVYLRNAILEDTKLAGADLTKAVLVGAKP